MSPRIAPIAPPYDARVAEDFEKLMPPGMPPIGLFRTLAHNPRVLRRIRRGGLLDPGSITLRQRELVILRTTARAGAEYEWGVHVAFFGAAAGFGEREIDAIVRQGPDAPCWSAEESMLVRATDELHESAQIAEPTWSGLRAHFSDEQIIEIVVLAGSYRAISYVVNATGVALEPGAPRFPRDQKR
jgi:alkylhydroperoxidase family enzyme